MTVENKLNQIAHEKYWIAHGNAKRMESEGGGLSLIHI